MDVLIADECEILRSGLRQLLESRSGYRVVAEAADSHAAVRVARELRPDLVVLDTDLPGLSGDELVSQIAGAVVTARFMAFTARADRFTIVRMLRSGTHGYVLKTATKNELLHAVNVVAQGHTYLSPRVAGVVSNLATRPEQNGEAKRLEELLSPRETEVLREIALGKTSKEIAERLSVTVRTIESHRAQVMRKLSLRSVAGLTKYAIREGLVSIDP